MRLTESEKNRILSLHNTEKNKFILSEKRFKLGKVRINKNKDGFYSLILNSKKWGFDPEKLKDTDKVFELITTSLSDEHPNLTSDRLLFGEKIDKFGGRDVYRFAILPQIAVTKSEEDEIKTNLEQEVEQTGSQTILNQEISTIISNFKDRLDGAVPSTISLTTSTDTETVQKANKTECPLDANGPIIRKGKRGERVKILQLMLMDCGYDLPKFGADGKFGKETYDAVEKYQIDNNLGVDGKAGPETIGSLCQCSTTKGVDVWQDEKYDNLKDELEQSSGGSREITDSDWPSQYGCVLKIDGIKKGSTKPLQTIGKNYYIGGRKFNVSFNDKGEYYYHSSNFDRTYDGVDPSGKYECFGDLVLLDKKRMEQTQDYDITTLKNNNFKKVLEDHDTDFLINPGYGQSAGMILMSVIGLKSRNSDDLKLAKKALEVINDDEVNYSKEFQEAARILYNIEIKGKKPSDSELNKLKELAEEMYSPADCKRIDHLVSNGIYELLDGYFAENYDGPLILGC